MNMQINSGAGGTQLYGGLLGDIGGAGAPQITINITSPSANANEIGGDHGMQSHSSSNCANDIGGGENTQPLTQSGQSKQEVQLKNVLEALSELFEKLKEMLGGKQESSGSEGAGGSQGQDQVGGSEDNLIDELMRLLTGKDPKQKSGASDAGGGSGSGASGAGGGTSGASNGGGATGGAGASQQSSSGAASSPDSGLQSKTHSSVSGGKSPDGADAAGGKADPLSKSGSLPAKDKPSLDSYNSPGMGERKQEILKAADKMKATDEEKAVLLAVANQETECIDTNYKTGDGKDGGSFNVTPYKMNVHQINKIDPSADPQKMHNDLGMATEMMIKGMRKQGMDNFLKEHRGGEGAFNGSIPKERIDDYLTGIKDVASDIMADPAYLNNDERKKKDIVAI